MLYTISAGFFTDKFPAFAFGNTSARMNFELLGHGYLQMILELLQNAHLVLKPNQKCMTYILRPEIQLEVEMGHTIAWRKVGTEGVGIILPIPPYLYACLVSM